MIAQNDWQNSTTLDSGTSLWAVVYDSASFTQDMYDRCLALLDADSQSRIRRFYRREDASRCLIGRLLPRIWLVEHGVKPAAVAFDTTRTGKPYIATPNMDRALDFNVSHNGALVVMAVTSARVQMEPAMAPPVGVDIMKVALSAGSMSFASFAESFRDYLTPMEFGLLFREGDAEGLRRFYWMWTLKEAYTKALGHGLGFPFRRIEYDVVAESVSIDGVALRGWRFGKFELSVAEETYQGVVTIFLGHDEISTVGKLRDGEVLTYHTADFIARAIRELEFH